MVDLKREFPVLKGPTGVGKDTLADGTSLDTAPKEADFRKTRKNDLSDTKNVRVPNFEGQTAKQYFYEQQKKGNVSILLDSPHGIRAYRKEHIDRVLDGTPLYFIISYKVEDEFIRQANKAMSHIENHPIPRPITILTGGEDPKGIHANIAARGDEDQDSRVEKATQEALELAQTWYKDRYVIINKPAIPTPESLETRLAQKDYKLQKESHLQDPWRKLDAINAWITTPREDHSHIAYLNHQLRRIVGLDYDGIEAIVDRGEEITLNADEEVVRNFLELRDFGLHPTQSFVNELVRNLQLKVTGISRTNDSIDVVLEEPPSHNSRDAVNIKAALYYLLIQKFGYYNSVDENRITFSLSDAPELPYYDPDKVEEPIQVRFHIGQKQETWPEIWTEIGSDSKQIDSTAATKLGPKIAREMFANLHTELEPDEILYVLKFGRNIWDTSTLDYPQASYTPGILFQSGLILDDDILIAQGEQRMKLIKYHMHGIRQCGAYKGKTLHTNALAGLLHSFGLAYEITGKEEYRQVMLTAAATLESLAVSGPTGARFIPRMESDHTLAIPTIFTAIPFLVWCAKYGTDKERYVTLANEHMQLAFETLLTDTRLPIKKYHRFDNIEENGDREERFLGNHAVLLPRTIARVAYGLAKYAEIAKNPKPYINKAQDLIAAYYSMLYPASGKLSVARAYPGDPKADLDFGAEIFLIQSLTELAKVVPSKVGDRYLNTAASRHYNILRLSLAQDQLHPAAILNCFSSGGAHTSCSIPSVEYVNLKLLKAKMN